MKSLRDKRVMVRSLVYALTAGLAVFMGINAGNIYNRWVTSEQRNEITEVIVGQMGTINVGDRLPDHTFEYLNRTPAKLSEIINGPTLITFISPSCPSCDDQLKALAQAVPKTLQKQRFILISPHNPRLLEDMRNNHQIAVPILYDHRREYWSQLKISSYPLNILVSEDRIIQDILVGEFLDEDFTALLQSNDFVSSSK